VERSRFDILTVFLGVMASWRLILCFGFSLRLCR